jgi:acetyl esterase/lipase
LGLGASHPPIDPELSAVIKLLRPEYQDESWTPGKIGELRELWRNYAPDPEELKRHGQLEIEELTIPQDGDAPAVRMLMLWPRGATGPRPCLYHVHGGGMVAGDSRSGLDYLIDWACRFTTVVASVEYRLAPEHQFPAPIDDTYRGLTWLVENARRIGIDPERIIITGASAGGGLAAATCLRARDAGGLMPWRQVLLSPMVDDRQHTRSSRYQGIPWDAASNHTGWAASLGDSCGRDQLSPYAAVARAQDLRGLPPTYIEVGEVEVFRDEVMALAVRLMADDVSVELHVWSGATHGFDAYAPQAAVSQAASAARLSFVRRTLEP